MNKQESATFNTRNIAEFRSTGGTVGTFGDAPLLLLTTIGSKSGEHRTSPMMYLADDHDLDRVYVFASAAGADNDPAWFDNLAASPHDLTVEIGRETLTADGEVVPEPTRTGIYATQADRYPGFAGYQAKTTRTIPVVALNLHRTQAG
jgi:deazaflavin-dependent oxidoreductase (nitroreductase family)